MYYRFQQKFSKVCGLTLLSIPLLLVSTLVYLPSPTAQKMKFYIKDFFNKCDRIRRKLCIWSHLLKKPLVENFMFCAVLFPYPLCLFNPVSFFYLGFLLRTSTNYRTAEEVREYFTDCSLPLPLV